eukprot:4682721-Lingulodinium_polyedra.AAC.1
MPSQHSTVIREITAEIPLGVLATEEILCSIWMQVPALVAPELRPRVTFRQMMIAISMSFQK